MKVALIADLHFGAKKSDDLFFESQTRFIRDVFLKKLSENGVEDIFILGDVFHDRKSISVKVLDSVSKLFKNDFSGFNVRIIVGNHDMYYTTDTEVNSINYLSFISPNIKVFSKISVDGDFLLVPWLEEKNREEFNRILAPDSSVPRFALGHLEMEGFGIPDIKEEELIKIPVLLSKFERTFSGHYHTPGLKESNGRKVCYLGAPYQLTRADKGEARGAYIFDTETLKLEFIENKVSAKFIEVRYPNVPDAETIKGNMVDIIVKPEDIDDGGMDEFLSKVNAMSPFSQPTVKIADDVESERVDVEVENKTMEQVLEEYLDKLNEITEEEKTEIKTEFKELMQKVAE